MDAARATGSSKRPHGKNLVDFLGCELANLQTAIRQTLNPALGNQQRQCLPDRLAAYAEPVGELLLTDCAARLQRAAFDCAFDALDDGWVSMWLLWIMDPIIQMIELVSFYPCSDRVEVRGFATE
jgi:hypothetical protein